MDKRHKLLEKIKNGPKSVSPAELGALLEAYGFVLKRKRGDHYMYKRKEFRTQVVPQKNPIRPGIVYHVLDIIEEIEMQEDK